MKATQVKKTYQITIEATDEELKNILFSLEQLSSYGAVEDLQSIIHDIVGDCDDDE